MYVQFKKRVLSLLYKWLRVSEIVWMLYCIIVLLIIVRYCSHGEIYARGFSILIPKEYNYRFENIEGHKNNNGRFLLLNYKKDNNPLIIINIYAPTKGKHGVQINFIEHIKHNIDEYSDQNIITRGNLNTNLNIKIVKR